jgi:hypothetical protein
MLRTYIMLLMEIPMAASMAGTNAVEYRQQAQHRN